VPRKARSFHYYAIANVTNERSMSVPDQQNIAIHTVQLERPVFLIEGSSRTGDHKVLHDRDKNAYCRAATDEAGTAAYRRIETVKRSAVRWGPAKPGPCHAKKAILSDRTRIHGFAGPITGGQY
jgi:hypothetical protein